jgi:hypothetical protein
MRRVADPPESLLGGFPFRPGWPPSNRNGGRLHFGTVAGIKSVCLAGMHRYSQSAPCRFRTAFLPPPGSAVDRIVALGYSWASAQGWGKANEIKDCGHAVRWLLSSRVMVGGCRAAIAPPDTDRAEGFSYLPLHRVGPGLLPTSQFLYRGRRNDVLPVCDRKSRTAGGTHGPGLLGGQ